MIGKLIYGVCSVVLVTTTAVLAQPSQGDANKQVCRSTGETGSRLSRVRTCHTVAEWAEIHRQTKQDVQKVQNFVPRDHN